MKKVCLLLLIILSKLLFSQKEDFSRYYLIKKDYENFPENDTRAFIFLDDYIKLAKKEKNYDQLAQGYKDAVFYSSSDMYKLKYADSTIFASILSKKKELISDAYLGKGIIYYFNYKKYKPALNEYLKAYENSKKTENEYLKNEILYHLGVVKTHLGYYEPALRHFEKTNYYFAENLKKNAHPNIIFNNRKGYYNSLHRMIVCHRNLKNYKAAHYLINIGLSQTQDKEDFQQEYGYFLKEKGFEQFCNNEFENSIKSLETSSKPISNIHDFAWIAFNYYYIGKNYLALNQTEKAIKYFQKVDSIFIKHNFILPELRDNYEVLINHYKNKKNSEKELYYTKQLLKADSIISKDFTYLSLKIHKEYDTKALLEEKERLVKATSLGSLIIAVLCLLATSLVILLIIGYRNEKISKTNYKILEEKIINNICTPHQEKVVSKIKDEDKADLNDNITNEILVKLKNFEKNCDFTEYGLTLHKLAHKLGTNSNYLSQVINERKGVHFNRYLSELRIHYITNKLYNDKVYLNYKIETLAEKCGIASRTNFSNLFREINGMRPTDFIKKRQKDIANNQKLTFSPSTRFFKSNQISSDHPNL
ncbi:MAG: AraC family transcriptional regulator [Chryseobacterium sp.]|nr:MAG: AraC family transcriptional regulator [Chryseobacterium sp.]